MMQSIRSSLMTSNVLSTHRLVSQACLWDTTFLARLPRSNSVSNTRGTPKLAAAMAASLQTAAAPAPVSGSQQRNAGPRVFADWAVYKGKAAMCLKVIKPEWSWGQGGDLRLARAGVMFLEFANLDTNNQQSGFGQRSYSWDQKQTFALSAVEMGTLISSNSVSLFHDPNKGKSNEGQVTKALKLTPSTDGKGGVLVNLVVKDPSLPGGQFYAVLPLTDGELAVLRSIANYLIPRTLGFSELFESQGAGEDLPPF